MTKAQEISRRILEKATAVAEREALPVNSAVCVREAFDFVLGEGAYDKLVSDLYDGLRVEAA